MDIGFEGEAYPSRDERESFGYSPNSIYVLAGDFDGFQSSQSFSGGSAKEVIKGLEDSFLAFEYINDSVSGNKEVARERSVPVYQQEVFPAELRPESSWISSFHEVERINKDVAETFFSATIHDNAGYFRKVDNFAQDLSEPSITASPDIQGVQAISYAPGRKDANIIQYSEELEIPEESTEHPPGAMIPGLDYRKVEYPREEEKIQELIDNHKDWEIDKITLPIYDIPPELRPQNDN